tara:strand:- start:13 stop:135 length:123 start_codon:yes stop_codon:yes gene_type:complete
MDDELFEDMIFYIENPSEGGDKYSKLIPYLDKETTKEEPS